MSVNKKTSTPKIDLDKKGSSGLRGFRHRLQHPKSPPPPLPHSGTHQDMTTRCPIIIPSSSFTSSSILDQDLSPTQTQIDLVRTSWERVSEKRHPTDDRNISPAHAFGLAFYEALFEMEPTCCELFANVFQQARALTGMISYIARAPGVTNNNACLTGLDSPPATPTIRDINARKRSEDLDDYEEGDPQWLAQQLRELGARHYFYNVKPHHFQLVGLAFAVALKKRLGDEYTDEIGEAWVKANSYAAHNMKIGFESQQAWEEGIAVNRSTKKKKKANCIIS
ncbi:hypothetical protein BD560DRAFT_411183 [Blakeslea trispora]|nr:hypothetical protein BD560DRAFT_411183 [Blakeslea trispora]